jgi:molybdate transport system substrate-binding protein
MDLLRDAQLKRLAIADPMRAPYGHAAMAALTNLRLSATLQPKLVTAANIAQAAQFAETGNADAGLISQTAAVTPALKAVGSFVVVPQGLYPAIEQGAVVLAKSPRRAAAQQMLDFLLSAEMQRQLQQSGLNPVTQEAVR